MRQDSPPRTIMIVVLLTLLGVVRPQDFPKASAAHATPLHADTGVRSLVAGVSTSYFWSSTEGCPDDALACRLRSAHPTTIPTLVWDNSTGAREDDIASNLAMDWDRRVYWINGAAQIVRLDPYIPGSTPEVLATKQDPHAMSEIASDGVHVYWTENRASSGALYRIPLDGGIRTTEMIDDKYRFERLAAVVGNGSRPGAYFLVTDGGLSRLTHVFRDPAGKVVVNETDDIFIDSFSIPAVDWGPDTAHWITRVGPGSGLPQLRSAPLANLSDDSLVFEFPGPRADGRRWPELLATSSRAAWQELAPGATTGPISILELSNGSIQRTHGVPRIYDLQAHGPSIVWWMTDGIHMLGSEDIEPASVRLMAIELNQGVQGPPHELGPSPHPAVDYLSSVPLIPRKATLVRAYYGYHDGPAPELAPPLSVTITKADGSTISHELAPMGPPVRPPRVAADGTGWSRAVAELRPDLEATVNYAINPELLVGARRLDLGGHVVATFGETTHLGLNLIALYDEMNPPPSASAFLSGTLDTLRSTLPYSNIHILSRTTARWSPLFGEDGVDNCAIALTMHMWAFGEHPPSYPDTEVNWWVPSIAYHPGGSGCFSGVVERFGGRIATAMAGRPAAHEIGHSHDLRHASNDHNEMEGGGPRWVEEWPYAHGAMSPDGHHSFGVLFRGPFASSPEDLLLIDPCPPTSAEDGPVGSVSYEDRFLRDPVCGLPDARVRHELMSYGVPSWISAINYGRMYSMVTRDVLDPPSGEAPAAAVGMSIIGPGSSGKEGRAATIVTGELLPDGRIAFDRMLTKPVLPGSLDEPEPANPDLTIQLLAADGTVLASRDTVFGYIDGTRKLFDAPLPAHPAAVTVRAISAGEITEVRFTDHVGPSLGGVRFDLGAKNTATLSWTAADDRAKGLETYVWLSDDGGTTWLPGAYVRAEDPTKLTLDTSELNMQGDLRVRVIGTDGPRSAMAVAAEGTASPDCTGATASPSVVKAKGHGMVPITVRGLGQAQATITSIRQDEPVNAADDGNTAPDADGVGGSVVEIRAERSGTGDGRVYHLGFEARVGESTCTGSVTVQVPLSNGSGDAVSQGPVYDSTRI